MVGTRRQKTLIVILPVIILALMMGIVISAAEPPMKYGSYYILNLSDGFGYFNRIYIGNNSPLDLESELYVEGNLNVTENATFMSDVIIEGTLFGGSPVKIAGGLNVSNGNVYFNDNLSVEELTIRSGDTFYFAGATFKNEGLFTSVNTDFGIHLEDESTAFFGIYVHNNSPYAIANFVLEAGSNTYKSVTNIVKNSPLHPRAPNATEWINEGGNNGIFVPHGKEHIWFHFDNLTKDEYGNIGVLGGAERLMTLNDTGLILDVGSFIGDGLFGKVDIGNEGLTTTSSDLNPSFNIVGNGDVFRIKQAEGVHGLFMSWYDNNSVRKGYYGYGQSANQNTLWLVNEETNGDIIINTAGTGKVVTNAQLDVTGDVWAFESAGNPRILVGDSGSVGQWGGLDWDSTSDYLQIINSGYSQSNGAINILSSGDVGIGTISPGDKFTVYDTSSVNARIQSAGPDTDAGLILRTATAPYWTLYEDESDSQKFKIKDSIGGDRLTIDSTGKVGIGTTEPGDKFTVYDTTASVNLRVQSTGPDADAGVVLRTATAPYWTILINESNSQKFIIKDSAGGDRLTIDTSGNLFVGGNFSVDTLSIIPGDGWIYLSGDGSIEEGLDISIPDAPGRDFYYGYGGGESHYFGTASDLIIHSNGNLITTGTGTFSDLFVGGNLTVSNINVTNGFTGTCVNTTYSGGIAISCND